MYKYSVILVFGFSVAACTSSSEEEPASKAVGVEGGTVTLEKVSVVVPQGALSEQVTMTITKTSDTAPAGYSAYSAVYHFLPEGVTFAKPVTVTLPFSGESKRAAIFWKGSTDSQFMWLGGTITGGDKISVEVSHFSRGVVMDGSCQYFRDSGTGSGPSNENCSVHATCHGQTFTAVCVAGSCTCKVDDMVTGTYENAGCYSEHCNFPAAVEESEGDAGPQVKPDAGPPGCEYSISSGGSPDGQVCTAAATCDGHDYSMTCSSGSGKCECTVDGQVKQTISGSDCEPQACGFPTDGPAADAGVTPDGPEDCTYAHFGSSTPEGFAICDASVECQGHAYSIHCSDETSTCQCTMDGSLVKTVPGTSCVPADCGFPGH